MGRAAGAQRARARCGARAARGVSRSSGSVRTRGTELRGGRASERLPHRHHPVAFASRAGTVDGQAGDSEGCAPPRQRGNVEQKRKCIMKCEEFEAIGLERSGLRMGELNAALRDAAAQSAAKCPNCAALQESWQEARIALQALRETTRDAETPRRGGMRLRQEFCMRRRTARARSAAIFAAWALAAAAVLFAGVSWWNWKLAQTQRADVSARNSAEIDAPAPAPSGTSDGGELVAVSEAG